MKSSFKYILIVIICSLSIVFLVQLFWLKGLYNTIEEETEKSLLECLNIANSHELEYRLDSMENKQKGDSYKGELSISQSIVDNDDKQDKTLSKKTGKKETSYKIRR